MMRKRLFFTIAVAGILTVTAIYLTFQSQNRLSSYASLIRMEQPNAQRETVGHGKNATIATTPRGTDGPRRRNITLVAHLRGEMGNNLSVLAHAYAVKLSIERAFPDISITLVGQHQDAPKWRSAARNLQTCFPSLRDFQFNGGMWNDEYRIRLQQQTTWLRAGQKKDETKHNLLHVDESCSRQGLCWREAAGFLQNLLQQQTENPGVAVIQEPPNANVSLPFLTSNRMSILDVLVDEFYDEIRQWFKLDEAACCKERPDKDETVFHFRNFVTEGPNLLKKGYQELDPNSTAEELFANLRPGDKIAIVSRFKTNLQPYVTALESKGLSVRVVENQTAVQDFCFLQSTKKELVGAKQSTFVGWAAILGEAEQSRLYAVNSSWTQKRGPGYLRHYTASRKELGDRLVFPIYQGRNRVRNNVHNNVRK
jgi:hypothetical protein